MVHRLVVASLTAAALMLSAGTAAAATISGTAGRDKIVGTGENDVILGFAGVDRLSGRGGDDLVRGGPGRDRIFGGPGDDELRGGLEWSWLRGGFGDDLLVAREGAMMFGGPGRDDLRGSSAHELMAGGYGDDVLRGRADYDVVVGGYGDDRVFGGPGDDFLSDTNVLGEREEWWQAPVPDPKAHFIEHDADLLVGGPGRDNIRVMSGPDRVFAGGGDDEIKNYGLDGAGDGFADLIHCGPGNDAVYLYAPTDPRDTVAADCEHIITFPATPAS